MVFCNMFGLASLQVASFGSVMITSDQIKRKTFLQLQGYSMMLSFCCTSIPEHIFKLGSYANFSRKNSNFIAIL